MDKQVGDQKEDKIADCCTTTPVRLRITRARWSARTSRDIVTGSRMGEWRKALRLLRFPARPSHLHSDQDPSIASGALSLSRWIHHRPMQLPRILVVSSRSYPKLARP